MLFSEIYLDIVGSGEITGNSEIVDNSKVLTCYFYKVKATSTNVDINDFWCSGFVDVQGILLGSSDYNQLAEEIIEQVADMNQEYPSDVFPLDNYTLMELTPI